MRGRQWNEMVRLNTPVVDDPESGFADQGSLKEFSPGAMALAACDLSSTKLAGAGVDLGRLGAERMRMMRVLDQAAVVELRKFAYLSQLAWAGTLLKQFGNYADATCLYIGHPHGRQLRLGSMCDFRWRLRVHKVTVIADISFGWPLPALGVTFPRWWATLANDLNKMKKLVHNKVGLLKIRMQTTTEVQLAFARRSLVMKYKQRPGCLRVIRGSCGVKLSGRTSFLLRIEQKKNVISHRGTPEFQPWRGLRACASLYPASSKGTRTTHCQAWSSRAPCRRKTWLLFKNGNGNLKLAILSRSEQSMDRKNIRSSLGC